MDQSISSLNLPRYKIEELRSLGYRYCNCVNISECNFSSKECNLSKHAPKTITALDVYQEECIVGNIFTLNKNLDDALQGGVPIGLITEFCGEPGSGKTQLCFQLCATVQLPKSCGGLSGKAIYIDTNRGFSSHRLKEIAAESVTKYRVLKKACDEVSEDEFDVETIMKNVYYIRITTHVELIAVIKHLEEWLHDYSSIRLIIIDSVSAPLKLLKGQEQTNAIYAMLTDLQILARRHKFAIVVTNNLTTRIVPQSITSRVPSLGASYYHRINLRIALSKTGNESKFTVLKSLYHDGRTQYELFT